MNREPLSVITNDIVNGPPNELEKEPIVQVHGDASNNNIENVQPEDPEIHLINQVPAARVHISTVSFQFILFCE